MKHARFIGLLLAAAATGTAALYAAAAAKAPAPAAARPAAAAAATAGSKPTPSLAANTSNPSSTPPTALSADDLQFFENKVRPILVQNCYKCHSRDADKVRGGLLLDSREGVAHGGTDGPVIVPGKPEESMLIEAIRYENEDLQMPQNGKLEDQQIADLVEWVRRGAPDPRDLVAKGSSANYGGLGKDHWSFQPVRKQTVPEVKNASWVKDPVDNFILAKLEASDVAPNPAADKRTLLRRATFDLTGLPPTEADIQAFIKDTSPDAFAKVVDRLLASPQYGERWGRYWLDVARYADTKGDSPNRDDPRYPHAWTYRDYVIKSFNDDKPYNQFIVEQLAADRLVANDVNRTRSGPSDDDRARLAALGFLTLGNKFDGNMNDQINDQIDVTSKAFLGLTVSCARCHDHKFDPIPQRDYYSLYGIFANCTIPTEFVQMPSIRPIEQTPEVADYVAKMDELKKKAADIQAQLVAFRQSKNPDTKMRQDLQKQQQMVVRDTADVEATYPGAPARANVIMDKPRTQDYPVLLRGEAQNKGEVVARRFLEILSGPNRPTYRIGSGRLELANAIASPTNPLTARVLVNRVWQQHFGVGFVATPDDLGNMSAPPTHPELLDYLAARFVDDGWSIKKLHRLIMLSSTYQESSMDNTKYADVDPDNNLHWRYNLRRLDFESVHDSLLAIAGTLDLTMGGKSIPIGSGEFATRRAVYAYIDRANPAEILTQFDFPNPSVPTGRRYQTIVPQQSLFLLNSPLVIETARKLTHRPEFLALTNDADRVASLYLAVFQRPPTQTESLLSIRYVQNAPGGTSSDGPVLPPAQQLASQRAGRAAQQQAAQAARAANNPRGRNFQSEPAAGAFTTRDPLDAWTKFAHALFQTNEAMFFN